MSQTTERLQRGSLRQLPLANGQWSWEWRYIDPATGVSRSKCFSGAKYPSRVEIENHLKPFIERLNSARVEQKNIVDPTFDDLLDKFVEEENLLEIKNRKPGHRAAGKDELAYSTATSYLSLCKRIRGRWDKTKLDDFKPLEFQKWLKEVDMKPKTKGHLKAFMNRLFQKAKLYELLDFHENPIALVEIRGISKRSRKPAVITIEQFYLIHGMLPKPYRDMAALALCTGMRVEEVLALEWKAIDFERLCMKVKEAVVNGRIGPVKSEYSDDELPLDPDLAGMLLEMKRTSNGSSLVFPSPITGRSYHASPIQQDWIRRAGWCLVDCQECGALPGCPCKVKTSGPGAQFKISVHGSRRDSAIEDGFGSIGWHTFRHSYRSLLIAIGAPLEVQKTLLRHADLSTTDDYGGPPMEEKRKANSRVVREILIRKSSI